VNERLQTKWLNGQIQVSVKIAANCTNSAYICNKFKNKFKKIELFGPTLLRNFPLKKSDFLGIFKNILTGFYCKCDSITHTVNLLHKIFFFLNKNFPLQIATVHECHRQLLPFTTHIMPPAKCLHSKQKFIFLSKHTSWISTQNLSV
jgi:hypothetical protein